jgi:hypothetical protein
MAPAHERLDGDHRPGGQVELGLVVDGELVLLERVGERAAGLAPAARAPVARRVEELEAVAAEALGAVHRGVRRLEELGARLVGAGLDRDADARRHRDAVVAVDLQRLRDRTQDAVGRRGDLRFVVDRVEQDGELVAAEARDRVDLADRVREAGGHGAQQLIAGLVAARVVDRLEPVESRKRSAERTGVRLARRSALSASSWNAARLVSPVSSS